VGFRAHGSVFRGGARFLVRLQDTRTNIRAPASAAALDLRNRPLSASVVSVLVRRLHGGTDASASPGHVADQ